MVFSSVRNQKPVESVKREQLEINQPAAISVVKQSNNRKRLRPGLSSVGSFSVSLANAQGGLNDRNKSRRSNASSLKLNDSNLMAHSHSRQEVILSGVATDEVVQRECINLQIAEQQAEN